MASPLRFSEPISMAFHALAILAKDPEHNLRVKQIASKLKISESHLAKVLQRLVKAGILESFRGPTGGFKINMLPKKIRLIDIYEIIEGPLEPHVCLLGKKLCTGQNCVFEKLAGRINRQLSQALKQTKLSDIRLSLDPLPEITG